MSHSVPAGSTVQLTGELDQHLSRWLWLVKMVLAIPHFIVLAFLRTAFLLTTMVPRIIPLVGLIGAPCCSVRSRGHARALGTGFVARGDRRRPDRAVGGLPRHLTGCQKASSPPRSPRE